ncbi:putative malonyl-CoA-acyl carrier protein transacylase, mitochondrial, partial [Fragariocoptes setiger]
MLSKIVTRAFPRQQARVNHIQGLIQISVFRNAPTRYFTSYNRAYVGYHGLLLKPKQNTNLKASLSSHTDDEKEVVVPQMAESQTKGGKATVILFPGQGSQYVGMVSKKAVDSCRNARALFEQANQILGYDLLKMCSDGPEYELNKTLHCQPAVLVTSLASVERLAQMNSAAIENCIGTAGFSVGEITALVLAGSLKFSDALKFTRVRAEVMQEISDNTASGMMTVFYGSQSKVAMACHAAAEFCTRSGMDKSDSVCSVANYLFPHCQVIAGHDRALEFVEKYASDFGIKRTKRLTVSGAFHTKIMSQGKKVLKNALSKIEIHTPRIKVYSNLDGKQYQSPDEIRRNLELHICAPVKWEQTIHHIYEQYSADLPITFECGPQKQMTTILAMINKKAKTLAFNVEMT